MKYSELKCLIEEYETWEQMKLGKQMPGRVPNPHLCNGQVQFASIENVTKNSSHDLNLPVVVGVGINYGQCPPRSPKRYTPHTPYLGRLPSGIPCVEDNPSKASPMRTILNKAFDAYENNPGLWTERYLAPYLPSGIIPPLPRNYLLVATNCTPFVTCKSWLEYDSYPADRAQVLAALDGQLQHLNDLLEILGPEVLWVGHGLGSEEYVLFRMWQERNDIRHWLLTAKLCGLSNPQFSASNVTKPFFERDRPAVPPFTKADMLLGPTDE